VDNAGALVSYVAGGRDILTDAAAPHVNFHHSIFNGHPYFRLNTAASNVLEQALPEGLQMSQPRLEAALRNALVSRSKYCTLRQGCEVIARPSTVPPIVEYIETATKQKKQLKGLFLVGADGKMGVVRKHFLEPEVGIKQVAGVYPYEGTWVASNLIIHLPTAETHPDFPLWKFGYTPDEVYNLFWPEGWHFASPPGRPTAAGRFGPVKDRTWRHEFRIDDKEKYGQPIYSEELLWEHLTPSITRTGDTSRHTEFGKPVTFPRDCIEILRCRPFAFTHKCVDQWFHEQTILVGDAAHVFPPFAGQGVASGMRDAHQLAWRLALAVLRPPVAQRLLSTWAAERQQSIDDAAMLSRVSGFICNNQPPLWFLLMAKCLTYSKSIPWILGWFNLVGRPERVGFSSVSAGFFLKNFGGGRRLAQVYLRSAMSSQPILSDALMRTSGTVFNILVVSDGDAEVTAQLHSQVATAIRNFLFDSYTLSENSVIVLVEAGLRHGSVSFPIYSSLPADSLDASVFIPVGYDNRAYLNRLVKGTRFAILRPDLFVFACAGSIEDLNFCLAELKRSITEIE